MKKILMKFSLILCFICCVSLGFCKTYEFVNQDILEILYGISLVEGKSIVGDDTVSGKGTFRFNGTNFEDAFDSFLKTNRLYVEKNENTWVVSKIQFKKENEKYFLDCYDVSLEKILEYISEKENLTIIAKSLPLAKNSFHINGDSVETLLSLLVKNWDDYVVRKDGNVIYVEKKLHSNIESNIGNIEKINSECIIENENGVYKIRVKNVDFESILQKLTTDFEFQFLSLLKENPKISWAAFQSNSFEEMLKTICSISDINFVKKDNIVVFFSDYNEGKKLINSKHWYTYGLKNISFEDFVTVFQTRFRENEIVKISESSLLVYHDESEKELIISFIDSVDVPKEKYLLEFDYISVTNFLENLPKGFSKNDFYSTTQDSSLFFYGSQEKYETLSELVLKMDKPMKKLSYDLLIIQTQKSSVENWNASLKSSILSPSNRTEASLTISPNFSFNADLVQAFGYLFATELQASIQENETEIFADTTLVGISGVPISFKNTNTFRYREPFYNLENGNQIQTGVTREIISGLVLEVLGTVSGNGTITTSVTASVSRRGADVTNSAGNPPPTSEKVISTQVIGKSGEVIVLSGLVQNDSTFVEEKTPWVSKIPIIGKLFSKDAKNTEKTEMIIYLVPHLESINHEIYLEKMKNLINLNIRGIMDKIRREK